MTIQPPRQHSATPVRIASGTARSALAQLSALCRRRDTSGTLPSAWMLSARPPPRHAVAARVRILQSGFMLRAGTAFYNKRQRRQNCCAFCVLGMRTKSAATMRTTRLAMRFPRHRLLTSKVQ